MSPVTPPAGAAADDLGDLAADRASLGRSSTAERVADILRKRIADGYFPPGTRLSEEAIGTALGVSRNTLREAFRLLSHERLLEHKFNRGAFVRVLNVQDVVDIYRVRKLIELSVVREATSAPDSLAELEAAVTEGEEAAAGGDWRALGTANSHFHQALVALAGSKRADEIMRGVLAELRLVFDVMEDPRRFHERYVDRNRQILESLDSGDRGAAAGLLADYLDDAERQLVAAYQRRGAEGGS